MFPKSSRKTESPHKNMLFLVIKARNSEMWSYKLDLSTTEGKTKSNYLQYRSFYYSQLDIVVHIDTMPEQVKRLFTFPPAHPLMALGLQFYPCTYITATWISVQISHLPFLFQSLCLTSHVWLFYLLKTMTS